MPSKTLLEKPALDSYYASSEQINMPPLLNEKKQLQQKETKGSKKSNCYKVGIICGLLCTISCGIAAYLFLQNTETTKPAVLQNDLNKLSESVTEMTSHDEAVKVTGSHHHNHNHVKVEEEVKSTASSPKATTVMTKLTTKRMETTTDTTKAKVTTTTEGPTSTIEVTTETNYDPSDDIWGEDDDEFDYNYDLTGSPVATTERLAKALNQHSEGDCVITTSNGDDCIFPFKEDGVMYNDSCVYYEGYVSSYYWCYTEGGNYGKCIDKITCKQQSSNDDEGDTDDNDVVCTSQGEPCHFPFTYQNKEYNNECVEGFVGASWNWCYIDDKQVNSGYCQPCQ